MKNVFLIGDSIRFGATGSPGYGVYVKEMLKDKANVYAPDDNCRFAQYTLRYLHEWVGATGAHDVDIVHWNNGLWDALELLGDEPFTPIPFYEDTIRRVYKRIRLLFPQARIIFALSTPVIEEWSHPDFRRHNNTIRLYNEAAMRALKDCDVEFDDLYAVAENFDQSLHSDWVHFSEEGSRILASAVVRAMGFDEKAE
ncbi:MAG: GDSL-type esterase/lipase family protein [Clostridia bacterium]|nr:GDSL-type esterase/lipase family protein [Clostridia bacterium]